MPPIISVNGVIYLQNPYPISYSIDLAVESCEQIVHYYNTLHDDVSAILQVETHSLFDKNLKRKCCDITQNTFSRHYSLEPSVKHVNHMLFPEYQDFDLQDSIFPVLY